MDKEAGKKNASLSALNLIKDDMVIGVLDLTLARFRATLRPHIKQVIPSLEQALPGYAEFPRFSSPKTHADKLRCPVLLFHARDDRNVPFSHSTDFAALVQKTNPRVSLVMTARGGHYDSMIREGIPRGIEWFQKGNDK